MITLAAYLVNRPPNASCWDGLRQTLTLAFLCPVELLHEARLASGSLIGMYDSLLGCPVQGAYYLDYFRAGRLSFLLGDELLCFGEASLDSATHRLVAHPSSLHITQLRQLTQTSLPSPNYRSAVPS